MQSATAYAVMPYQRKGDANKRSAMSSDKPLVLPRDAMAFFCMTLATAVASTNTVERTTLLLIGSPWVSPASDGERACRRTRRCGERRRHGRKTLGELERSHPADYSEG